MTVFKFLSDLHITILFNVATNIYTSRSQVTMRRNLRYSENIFRMSSTPYIKTWFSHAIISSNTNSVCNCDVCKCGRYPVSLKQKLLLYRYKGLREMCVCGHAALRSCTLFQFVRTLS